MINEQGVTLTPVRPFKRFALAVKGAVTGITPVQAIPTTAAQWAIINKSAVGTGAAGNSPLATAGLADTMFIEDIGVFLTSGTPGLGASLWGAFFTVPVTGTMATNLIAQNYANGDAVSAAVAASGVTISTPAAPNWFPIAESISAVAAAAYSTGYSNSIVNRNVKGRLAIPPGQALALAVIGPAGTTPLYAPILVWSEQQSALS